MQAIRVHDYGDPSMLRYESVERPDPAVDELLVRVRGAGLNPVDTAGRYGQIEYPLPWIPGWDLSGTVAAVGDAVTDFKIDDDVYSLARFPDAGNAYAEYATVPATDVAAKPATIDPPTAAGVPMVALTAWEALFEQGDLQDDDRVLIHAAAGGVGHIAVQLALQHGATVIGTAAGYNQPFLTDLGVDQAIDYETTQFDDAIDEPVDLVLDAIGGKTGERSLSLLRAGGTITPLLDAPPEEQLDAHGVDSQQVGVEADGDTLSEIATLIDDGAVTPTIAECYPLADATAAHEELESDHARGKLVLEPDSATDS
ncbi:NADPH:quinone reductase [Halococcus morrhuae DSM 1307]|uniref:NADPH:quinone reductase n=1 Tax=Halococcus morrhuae DSM 1307 TaxID=931277 RepID=M0MAR0_HALMO|nr:NADP-dependent oxidoreductase [Halococcus morrhuae]EMA42428.1 NADPH:quinone reductase [Halococcus morrhuae DSM 1307]